MDSALELLDRLERALHRNLGRFAAEHRQAIEAETIGLLRMIRAALPRELHHAAGMQEEAEGVLARAREEARRLILEAQAHARSLAAARPSGGQVGMEEVSREADRVRRGADEYAVQVLHRLEGEVERVLAAIRRGQEVLRGPSAPVGREPSAEPPGSRAGRDSTGSRGRRDSAGSGRGG
jgi:cell division septum initiation protein DivIVA